MLIISDRVNPESTSGLMFPGLLSFSRLVRPEMKMCAGCSGIAVCLEWLWFHLFDFMWLSRKKLRCKQMTEQFIEVYIILYALISCEWQLELISKHIDCKEWQGPYSESVWKNALLKFKVADELFSICMKRCFLFVCLFFALLKMYTG